MDSLCRILRLYQLQRSLYYFSPSAELALEQSLRQAMEGGIPSAMRTLMGEDQSQNTFQRLTGLREQLEKQEQEQKTPITVRHYHCDHLGTPLALSDSQGQIVWAARLDPWGNVEEEFNPHQLEQSIRLPGQHHDRETNLYYNRHRYYDPTIGSYVNQDPIGWEGGANLYLYPLNPIDAYDTLGLNGESSGAWEKIKKTFDWGSKAKDAKDKAETAKKANDVLKQQKELRKINEELFRCADVPTPKDCPSGKELQEMEKKAHTMTRENVKGIADVYKDMLDTPGTSTGGPIAGPRPRIP